MPSVDFGVIVANDETWLKVKPKCPYDRIRHLV